VARLIACVLERHDRTRFEVTALSLGPDDASPERRRIERVSGQFIDVAQERDENIAALVRRMEVDIAVDLTAFTGSGRRRILTLRPAPVQVNFLGFAGTMGAAYMDYLIADPVVIGEAERSHYSEKIVTLPHSYLAAELGSTAANWSRAQAGLPKEGFVF